MALSEGEDEEWLRPSTISSLHDSFMAVPASPDWDSADGEAYIEAQLSALRSEVEDYEAEQNRLSTFVVEEAPVQAAVQSSHNAISLPQDLAMVAQLNRAVAMSHSFLRGPVHQQPWEKGALRNIFGKMEIFPTLRGAAIPPPVVVREPEVSPIFSEFVNQPAVASVRGTKRVALFTTRSTLTAAKPKDRDCKRDLAIAGFVALILQDPDSFGEARLLAQSGDKALDTLHDHLTSVLARKATGTLTKRLGSWRLFEKWAVNEGHATALPLSEALVHQYATSSKVSKVATRLQAFLEAIGFAVRVLGLDSDYAKFTYSSGRLKGLSSVYQLSKGPVKQARPLRLSHILVLEDILFSPGNAQESVIAGGILAMLYARSRCNDAQHSQALVCDFLGDEGFLELQSSDIKTATSVAKRRRLLPMVAPAKGLSSRSWAQRWMRLRTELGLSLAEGFPVLPELSRGGFIPEPMSSQRVSAWLIELLLQHGVPESELDGVSSHSLKCTLLSWAAKFGLPADVRRFLGHHTKAEDGSLLIYGRDNAAGPLRSLVLMLSAVRAGAFMPDLTRSGRFIPREERVSISCPGPAVAPELVLNPDMEDLSDSESSSDSEDEVPAYDPDPEQVQEVDVSVESRWVHCKLGTVHFLREGSEDLFVCGRRRHDGHAQLPASEDLNPFHCCLDCSR